MCLPGPRSPPVRAGAAGAALEGVPAEVLRHAAEPRRRERVDLLPAVLSDVADVQAPVESVEGVPPRIAEAVGVDPPAGADVAGIQAQELPVEAAQALRAPAGVAASSSVALAGVQPAVRAEVEPAAVVVPRGLGEGEQQAPRGRKRAGVRGGRPVARDARVASDVRVVDVQEVVRRVGGIERDPEQPPFPAAGGKRANVQEERARPALELVDLPLLLDDVQRPGGVAALRRRHLRELVEAARDELELRRRGGGRNPEREDEDGREGREKTATHQITP